ncbi:MAG: CHAT domain-containing protein, partial [Egibacteraceae bacterium]
MGADQRVPGFLGRVLTESGDPIGTCFQVEPGVLVTAWHVVDDLGAGDEDATVRVDPLQGGTSTVARVARVDPVHDLAVLLMQGNALPACVAGLAATDEIEMDTRLSITGVSELPDPEHSYRFLNASAKWRGGTTRDDQVSLGRLEASGVVRGMSGAPVLCDGVVVGVVSARYNSADGWGRDSVWVARVEDLAALLDGIAEVEVTRWRWHSSVELTLAVDAHAVKLSGAGVAVVAEHPGVTPALADAVRGLARVRAGLTAVRRQPQAAAAGVSGVAASPEAVGRLMAGCFLPGPVARGLAEVITNAQRQWAAVRLGVRAHPDLQALPWEALSEPGGRGPVALHPLMTVYRQCEAAPVDASPGPLRILIAISSPLSGGGSVLDYERELRNVLAAVRSARQGRAHVRIVHFATTGQIRQALRQEPAHVLHLSGHGRPGLMELEGDDGNARLVTADQLVEEAIPPGRMPPVIALAACHTDVATASGDPSFAARLIGLGARVVIGTETSVTDVYATRLFTRIYGILATAERPDIVEAVADARRAIQRELVNSPDERERRLAALGEWAVVTVLAGSGSALVFDPTMDAAAVSGSAASPRRSAGLAARQVGEFVGRRREQRRWPAQLLGAGAVGIVLHGIGGVGKTALAAELADRISEREPARLIVTAGGEIMGGQVSVDHVLGALARQLRVRLRTSGSGEALAAVEEAQRVDLEWRDRLALLRDNVLGDVPVLLILDNFEDNLSDDTAMERPGWRAVRDSALADLLAGLIRSPGQCRLLITSRYPFALPARTERLLSFKHLGPLSLAETLKLAWALPGLDRLAEPELERVWRMVGGHPRCLEYLDALLSGGRGAYPDVTARLAAAVGDRLGVTDLDAWFAQHATLEPALAETLTLAADDVLLDRLLASLAEHPGAQRLLLGVSVYRAPVDLAGLLFQVGEQDPSAAYTPDRSAARQRIADILQAAGHDRAGPIDMTALPPPLRQQLAPHLGELQRAPSPPRRAAGDLQALVEAAAASSLLTLTGDEGEPAVFVHRWTADELHRRWLRAGYHDQLAQAHRRAAEYWRWRVNVWPQGPADDLEDRLEARYHLLAAGQPDAAAALTEGIVDQLHAWGAWDREEALIRDTLAALPAASDRRGAWTRQLADVAAGRSRLAEAGRLYRQALTIHERLVGLDPANTTHQQSLSVSYTSLGDLAQAAGNPAEAERLHRQALTIGERLVGLDPANTTHQQSLSVSYDRLGDLARAAGDPGEAERLHR